MICGAGAIFHLTFLLKELQRICMNISVNIKLYPDIFSLQSIFNTSNTYLIVLDNKLILLNLSHLEMLPPEVQYAPVPLSFI